MRLVVQTDPGVVEVCFMWLPVFIGQDVRFLQEMGAALKEKIEGKPLTEETLDWAHDLVVEFICKRYAAIKGLRDYLDACKFVENG